MIVYPVLLVSFLASAYSASVNESPHVGTAGDLSTLDAPYMASITFKTDFESTALCGGTIIGNKYILTSAGCVMGYSASDLIVRIGTNEIEHGGIVYNVTKTIMHEKYMTKPYYADIAILKLDASIAFGPKVRKIFLNYHSMSLQIKMNVNVTGWGCGKGHRLMKDNLRRVTVPIRKVADCVVTSSEVNKKIICAGAATHTFDVCLGDIGGPLTYKGVQYGIVSYPETGTPKGLGIYTKIRTFYIWIMKTMQTM